ncbi:hypothetical protein GCM10009823_09920 [Brevibacterium salitolerans]|uniref:Uncharacterized protein n=1 Tax=Brevibacterium salitolerans TaxID=1403566 RepID=A0ABN2WH35_9MICO
MTMSAGIAPRRVRTAARTSSATRESHSSRCLPGEVLRGICRTSLCAAAPTLPLSFGFTMLLLRLAALQRGKAEARWCCRRGLLLRGVLAVVSACRTGGAGGTGGVSRTGDGLGRGAFG